MDSKYTLTYHNKPRSIIKDVFPMLDDPGNERKSVTIFLGVAAVQYLISIGMISTEDQSGNAPTTGEFLQFMNENHNHKFELIANATIIDDTPTLCLEMVGVEYQGDVTFDMAVAFVEWFRLAEVFSVSNKCLYCAFD